MAILRNQGILSAWGIGTLLLAGCASSEFALNEKQRSTWMKVDQQRLTDVQEVSPPKIAPETYFAAGQLFESRRDFEKAIGQYRKAVVTNHQFVAPMHRMALLLSYQGRHEQALEWFRKAVELEPQNAVLRNNFGYQLMLTRHWAEAIQEFDRAIDLDREFARPYINRGMAQSKMGRFDDALVSFRQVLPEEDAHYNLGLMYRANQRYAQAVEAFARVVAMNPKFTAALVQLDEIRPKLEELSPVDPIEAFATGFPYDEVQSAEQSDSVRPTMSSTVIDEEEGEGGYEEHEGEGDEHESMVTDEHGNDINQDAADGQDAMNEDDSRSGAQHFPRRLDESEQHFPHEAHDYNAYEVSDQETNSNHKDQMKMETAGGSESPSRTNFLNEDSQAFYSTSFETLSIESLERRLSLEDQLSIIRNEIDCLEESIGVGFAAEERNFSINPYYYGEEGLPTFSEGDTAFSSFFSSQPWMIKEELDARITTLDDLMIETQRPTMSSTVIEQRERESKDQPLYDDQGWRMKNNSSNPNESSDQNESDQSQDTQGQSQSKKRSQHQSSLLPSGGWPVYFSQYAPTVGSDDPLVLLLQAIDPLDEQTGGLQTPVSVQAWIEVMVAREPRLKTDTLINPDFHVLVAASPAPSVHAVVDRVTWDWADDSQFVTDSSASAPKFVVTANSE